MTFSAGKPVSALWAPAPREVAEQVEAAHAIAVADTLTWLGTGGVRQVETTGLVAAVFTHRDSRAGDRRQATDLRCCSPDWTRTNNPAITRMPVAVIVR